MERRTSPTKPSGVVLPAADGSWTLSQVVLAVSMSIVGSRCIPDKRSTSWSVDTLYAFEKQTFKFPVIWDSIRKAIDKIEDSHPSHHLDWALQVHDGSTKTLVELWTLHFRLKDAVGATHSPSSIRKILGEMMQSQQSRRREIEKHQRDIHFEFRWMPLFLGSHPSDEREWRVQLPSGILHIGVSVPPKADPSLSSLSSDRMLQGVGGFMPKKSLSAPKQGSQETTTPPVVVQGWGAQAKAAMRESGQTDDAIGMLKKSAIGSKVEVRDEEGDIDLDRVEATHAFSQPISIQSHIRKPPPTPKMSGSFVSPHGRTLSPLALPAPSPAVDPLEGIGSKPVVRSFHAHTYAGTSAFFGGIDEEEEEQGPIQDYGPLWDDLCGKKKSAAMHVVGRGRRRVRAMDKVVGSEQACSLGVGLGALSSAVPGDRGYAGGFTQLPETYDAPPIFPFSPPGSPRQDLKFPKRKSVTPTKQVKWMDVALEAAVLAKEERERRREMGEKEEVVSGSPGIAEWLLSAGLTKLLKDESESEPSSPEVLAPARKVSDKDAGPSWVKRPRGLSAPPRSLQGSRPSTTRVSSARPPRGRGLDKYGLDLPPDSPLLSPGDRKGLRPMQLSAGGFEELLLGSLERSGASVPQRSPEEKKRGAPWARIEGFSANLGVSGTRESTAPHRRLKFPARYLRRWGLDAPYVADAKLGPEGYRVPSKGVIQLVLANPSGQPIRALLTRYDISDMPPGHKTFLRHKLVEKQQGRPSLLRYAVQLHFVCPESKRWFLHHKIRVIFYCRSFDAELESEITCPEDPKFFPVGAGDIPRRR